MELIKKSKNSKKIPNLYINVCLTLFIAIEGIYGIIDADILWDKIWWVIGFTFLLIYPYGMLW